MLPWTQKKRHLFDWEMDELDILTLLLENVMLVQINDVLLWELENSGIFQSKSASLFGWWLKDKARVLVKCLELFFGGLFGRIKCLLNFGTCCFPLLGGLMFLISGGQRPLLPFPWSFIERQGKSSSAQHYWKCQLVFMDRNKSHIFF